MPKRKFAAPGKRLVSVVDDDESMRESLPDLLKSLGYEARPFSSAEEFLASKDLKRTGCLVLDVSMPGMSGPELQMELARRRLNIPIVFITAHADTRVGQKALKEGAVAFLFKPFSETEIDEAVNTALGKK